MSTQRLNSHRQKHKAMIHATLVVFGVFTLMLSLLSSITLPAFAASTRSHASQPSQPPEDITRSGVSVVRLVTSYGTPPTGKQIGAISIQCTGLGIIVASWTSTKTDEQNNWILTDGALVNPLAASCTSSTTTAILTSVEIIPSNAYTTKTPVPSFTISGPFQSITTSSPIHCQETQNCSQGPALLSFNTPAINTLPYADAPTGTTTTPQAQVELASTSQSLPSPFFASGTTYSTKARQYLTPNGISTNVSDSDTDKGLPLVNSSGELVAMHLMSGKLAADKISAFLSVEGLTGFSTKHQNPVHDDWLQAMNDYYKTPQTAQNVKAAQTALQQASSANPQFDGANTLVQAFGQSQAKPTGNSISSKTTNDSSTSNGGLLSSLPALLKNIFNKDWLPASGIAALIILLVLIVLVNLLFRRARTNRRLEKEFEEANKQSELEMKQQQQRRATADKPTLIQSPIQLPYVPTQDVAPEPPRQMSPLKSLNLPYVPPPGRAGLVNNTTPSNQELHCPHCGFIVPRGTISCPSCHMLLSPSESGLHLRVRLQPVAPSASIEDQPTSTMPMGTPNATYDADKTKPDLSREAFDPQKTLPNIANMRYDTNARMQAVGNYPPGFVVIPRTNRGLKRKHKANEDSVFAAQGARLVNGRLQQVGVFVVADGMGGHANGQDASRTAIKRIREYMLPILEEGHDLSPEDFKQFLMNGVREANRAVHRRNTEQHADMGTTMTAALVVDMPSVKTLSDGQQVSGPVTAYVVNVGDSRTYLYRDSGGLKKLTLDHSVVASLVAAGIIEEDDIYTHPKRNQIYRSLGEKMEVEVDAFVEPLQPNDKLLLCSDGLWDMVRDPKLELTIRNNMPNLEKVGDGLINAALEGGGEDNVSIIFVHVPEDGKRVAEAPGIQVLDIPGRDSQ